MGCAYPTCDESSVTRVGVLRYCAEHGKQVSVNRDKLISDHQRRVKKSQDPKIQKAHQAWLKKNREEWAKDERKERDPENMRKIAREILSK